MPNVQLRATPEARWFVPWSAIAPPLRPVDEVRTDRYHRPTLTPTSAWKLRGDDWLEFKHRVGPSRPVLIAGVSAVMERWRKVRVRPHTVLAGPWIVVEKEKWLHEGVELALVRVGGARCWSVAIDGRRPHVTGESLEWWGAMARHGVSASFACWLAPEGSVELAAEPGGRTELNDPSA